MSEDCFMAALVDHFLSKFCVETYGVPKDVTVNEAIKPFQLCSHSFDVIPDVHLLFNNALPPVQQT